jgi:SAM-dependent methyltransferase
VTTDDVYYRADLARIHHLGFGSHAEACAAGILDLLKPVHAAGGTVLELGCGSGALTQRLIDAGHRVIATDASPAMLDLAREHVKGAEDIRPLVLPGDPLPTVDAIVSVGHVFNYLNSRVELCEALVASAAALRPGGILAIDLLDLAYGALRRDAPPAVNRGPGWMVVAEFSHPSPETFVRHITSFVHSDDGSWRRDDERHVNILVDSHRLPGLISEHGITAEIRPAFGAEVLPEGMVALVGHRDG